MLRNIRRAEREGVEVRTATAEAWAQESIQSYACLLALVYWRRICSVWVLPVKPVRRIRCGVDMPSKYLELLACSTEPIQ